MAPGTLRIALLTGVAFCGLNLLWLIAASAPYVPEAYRGFMKVTCLLVALTLFVLMTGSSARQPTSAWLGSAALAGGVSVGFGLVLILLASALWYPGQFFHDGLRLPTLATLLIGGIIGGSVVAAAIGAVARMLLKLGSG